MFRKHHLVQALICPLCLLGDIFIFLQIDCRLVDGFVDVIILACFGKTFQSKSKFLLLIHQNYSLFIDLPEHHPTTSSYHFHEFMAVFIVNGHLKVADGRFDRLRLVLPSASYCVILENIGNRMCGPSLWLSHSSEETEKRGMNHGKCKT